GGCGDGRLLGRGTFACCNLRCKFTKTRRGARVARMAASRRRGKFPSFLSLQLADFRHQLGERLIRGGAALVALRVDELIDPAGVEDQHFLLAPIGTVDSQASEIPALRSELLQRGRRDRSFARVQQLAGMGFHVCQHVLFVVFRKRVGIDGFFRFPPESEFGAAGHGGEKQDEDAGQDCFRGLARHWCPRRPQGCRFGPIYRTSKLTQTAPNIQSCPRLAATSCARDRSSRHRFDGAHTKIYFDAKFIPGDGSYSHCRGYFYRAPSSVKTLSPRAKRFGLRKKPRMTAPLGAIASCRLPAGRHTN